MRVTFDSFREQVAWTISVVFGLGLVTGVVFWMLVAAVKGTWRVCFWFNWYGEAVPELVMGFIGMCCLAALLVSLAYGEAP